MAGTSTVRVLFLGDASSAIRSTRQLSGAFGGLGKAAGLAGKVLAVGVVGGLAASVKAAVDFDKAMRNVNSIAKLNEKQFKSLSKQVLALAKDTGQAPKALAEGMYDVVSSGFKANQALKILKASAVGATAGLTDTATATKAVVSVLNAYHMEADQAQKVTDILFQTVNKGVLTFEELASQIGDVLPIASQLGVPLEDVGGALATITLHGVNAAEAATQLKQLYVSLLKPSEDLAGVIKKMGFESGETAIKQLGLAGLMSRLTQAAHGSGKAFADWFPNVRAMNGALGISGKNISTLRENIEAMHKSQGAASDAFKEQSKSISVQWMKVKAALTAAAIPIGQALFPVLTAVIDKVGQFATKLQEAGPQIRSAFADIGSVIGPVADKLEDMSRTSQGQALAGGIIATVIAGKGLVGVGKSIGSIGAGLKMLGPWGTLAAVGIGAVTAAFIASRAQADAFEKKLDEIKEALGEQVSANTRLAIAVDNNKRALIEQANAHEMVVANERLLKKVMDESGKKSQAYRDQLQNLKLAKLHVRDANRAVVDSEKEKNDAQKAAGKSTSQTTERVKELARELVRARAKADEAKIAALGYSAAGRDVVQSLAAWRAQQDRLEALGKFISTLHTVQAELRKVASQARAAGDMVGALRAQIQLLKSKAIEIKVRYSTSGRPPSSQNPIPELTRPSAAGGVMPGHGTGDTVAALLTPGEVVLNRRQQTRIAKKLGVPDSPFSIFDAAQRFASGGIAGFGGGGGRRPRPTGSGAGSGRRGDFGGRPVRESGGPLMNLRSGAATIMKPIIRHRQLIEDKFDWYDLKSREFDQSQEEYLTTVTDPVTKEQYEVLNQPDIDKRLEELKVLFGLRQEILELLREEREMIRLAIIELKRQLVLLRNELVRQKRRHAQAKQEVAMLKKVREAMKKHPPREGGPERMRNLQALIAWWQAEEDDAAKIVKRLDKEIPEYPTAISAATGWQHELPKEIRSAELDVKDIELEADAVRGVKAAGPSGIGADTGGGGGDLGDFLGGDGGGADSDEKRRLLEIIARLRQALGIQAAQLGLIEGFEGRFASGGFIKAPMGAPRLALVHGGEMILNPRQLGRLGGARRVATAVDLPGFAEGGYVGPRSLGSAGDAPPRLQVRVQHNYAPGMEWLRQFVDTRVSAQQVAVARGAEILRREGRFG